MSTNGRVNLITDPTAFFSSVLLGDPPQSAAYVPATGVPFVLKIVGGPQALEETFSIAADVNETDGTFVVSGFREGLPIDVVAISLTLNSTQFFRTEYFNVAALDQPIELFLLQPRVATTNAITAGQISNNLKGSGLPGNTRLTANASGLSIAGSKEGAHIQFGVSVVPDISFNLNTFVDLALNGWSIHVGWPADLCESAKKILRKIRKNIQTSGSSVNGTVLSSIESALTSPPENLTSDLASELLKLISIQFISIVILNSYTWPLKDTTDSTPILFAQPVFGYPRRFDEK